MCLREAIQKKKKKEKKERDSSVGVSVMWIQACEEGFHEIRIRRINKQKEEEKRRKHYIYIPLRSFLREAVRYSELSCLFDVMAGVIGSPM